MLPQPLLLAAVAITYSHQAIAGRTQDIRPNKGPLADILTRRQSDDFPYNETSICLSYGIDYQNGGSYFIDSRSTESFTVVSQFEDCEPDTTAYVLLVDDNTGEQLECSGVATTPDLTNVVSTCPITKNQMTSGEWAILVIGNNGDGSPYAWQREFVLTVGVPTTSTTTSTVTFTQTTTPSTTVTTTSTLQTTTSVPNKSKITIPAATKTVTIMPKAQTITSTKWLTRTINTWTKTESKITKTIVPSCTVPVRPSQADPICRILPTIISLPLGLTISISKEKRADNAMSLESIRKRFENSHSHKARLAREAEKKKRSPDAPTVYVQAPIVVNVTTTATAPISTISSILLTTFTATVTDPPSTVKSGTKTVSTTLPTQTKTITKIGYTTITTTKIMAVTWTYSTTVIPSASASACKSKGGHYGIL